MASEKVGKVFKGEGPVSVDNGIVLPFDYKNGVFSSEVHQLALSNQELDLIAVQSMLGTGLGNDITLKMPGPGKVFVKADHVISDRGKIDMVTQLSSVTENPYTGIAFHTERRFGQKWTLQDLEKVPDITMMTWVVDRMTSKVLGGQVEQKRRDIKNREEERFEELGIPKSLDIYA